MKLKFNCLLLLLFSNLIFSQSKEYTKCYTIEYNDTFNGNIKNSIYSCKMFDWKIKIPLRYHVMHLKAIEELNKWGIEAVATPNSNPNSYNFKRDPYYLISFGIDNSCVFTTVYESLAGTEKISLEEHKRLEMQSLNNFFSKIKEVKAILNSSNFKIGKYDFYRIQTKVYNLDTGELIITQELYNSFINTNVLFRVIINYVNETDGKILIDNFISSFKK